MNGGQLEQRLLVLVTLALVAFGLVMVYSATSAPAALGNGDPSSYLKKQGTYAVLGVVVLILASRVDIRVFRRAAGLLVGSSLLLCAAVLVVGEPINGARRWISFGPAVFQPSELAKLAVIGFAAAVLARRWHRLDDPRQLAFPLVPLVLFLAMLIMLQPDLGTTLLLSSIGFGMLFIAGAPMTYLVPMAASGAGLALIAAFAEPYRRARLLAFAHPWKDPLNTGYQTIQSLIAMGSGSWFGVGLGASRQKWSYVPNAHTDFIFAILGEEMGFLGTLAVVGLFAFIAYLGVRIAKQAPDRFGMLLAAGVTIWISVQALVNMGAVTGTLPITGVPLPLVSFGGTSLVVSLAGMGILSNVARQGKAPRVKSSARV